tara:strand:- start:365 stop:496 length:132 start_codon:yes stop_codon:yes gene_type:complete
MLVMRNGEGKGFGPFEVLICGVAIFGLKKKKVIFGDNKIEEEL